MSSRNLGPTFFTISADSIQKGQHLNWHCQYVPHASPSYLNCEVDFEAIISDIRSSCCAANSSQVGEHCRSRPRVEVAAAPEALRLRLLTSKFCLDCCTKGAAVVVVVVVLVSVVVVVVSVVVEVVSVVVVVVGVVVVEVFAAAEQKVFPEMNPFFSFFTNSLVE